jgi:hypothetical protein
MKNIFAHLLFCILIIPLTGGTSTLQQVYNNASAGLGYDKLIQLDKDSVYLGGLAITNQKVGIKGRGAIIDLQGSSINVTGNSAIDLDGCVLINGTSAIYATESVTAKITQCTFYGNQIGIHFMAISGMIEVVNTILAHSSQYGFACEETTVRILHYINTYDNLQGDYMEWCPG